MREPWAVFLMALCCLLLLQGVTAVHAATTDLEEGNAASVPSYTVTVRGALGDFETTCLDPCHIDETRSRGDFGGVFMLDEPVEPSRRTGSSAKRDHDRSYAEDGITCIGNCSPERTTTLSIGSVRTLTEGVEVRIRDDRARIVFHTVIERDGVPTIRRRVSEFKIDRPVIELELHDHAVTLRRMDPDNPGAK